jgi:hypothetical protein
VRTKKKRLWRQRSISPSLFSILVEADDGEGKRMASPGEVQCEARGYLWFWLSGCTATLVFFFFFFFFQGLVARFVAGSLDQNLWIFGVKGSGWN